MIIMSNADDTQVTFPIWPIVCEKQIETFIKVNRLF